ncbi:hypothetical protein [Asanoa iriomotensis]|uniref:DUF4179 domain-containing protein n=1 Tax=Asanoa iriomotensis TaxID=234613 RepID=A0ABQ4CDW2_9ACTN|nr:hypothetical protein [Asanoa iriomotensis]GIF60967.1 hypothetical protein Air01nite_70620 [Asanoa iriomotensis]
MTVDERVHDALTDLADGVRPAPDPYGRLRTRHRRVQRQRGLAAGLALAAVTAVGAVVPTLDREGPTAADIDRTQSVNAWAERLRNSPVRGAVGSAEPAYVAELERMVAEHQRAGAFRVTAPVSEVNVLYLDDIGGARVAFVAFHLATPDPATSWANSSAWLVARAGAPATELADPLSIAGGGDGLEPFEVMSGLSGKVQADATVALAPDGCVVESAPLPDVDAWRPEPTGSYLIRAAGTERPEWWRVVCDGVVKDERPATRLTRKTPLRAETLDAALVGARGKVDLESAREVVRFAEPDGANILTGPTRVLWGGRISGAKPDANGPFDGTAVLTAAPYVRGGWQIGLDVTYDGETSGGAQAVGLRRWSAQNPIGPDTVVPIRLGESASVLVVVPAGATTVRVMRAGTVVDTASVADDAALVDAPDDPGLTFEALDRDGAVLSVGRLPGDPPVNNEVVSW